MCHHCQSSTRQSKGCLTVISPKTYSQLKNLCALEEPAGKGECNLITLLNFHLMPKPLIGNSGTFPFSQKVPNSGRKCVLVCRRSQEVGNFAETLNGTRRNHFVCGLRHEVAPKCWHWTMKRRLVLQSQRDAIQTVNKFSGHKPQSQKQWPKSSKDKYHRTTQSAVTDVMVITLQTSVITFRPYTATLLKKGLSSEKRDASGKQKSKMDFVQNDESEND